MYIKMRYKLTPIKKRLYQSTIEQYNNAPCYFCDKATKSDASPFVFPSTSNLVNLEGASMSVACPDCIEKYNEGEFGGGQIHIGHKRPKHSRFGKDNLPNLIKKLEDTYMSSWIKFGLIKTSEFGAKADVPCKREDDSFCKSITWCPYKHKYQKRYEIGDEIPEDLMQQLCLLWEINKSNNRQDKLLWKLQTDTSFLAVTRQIVDAIHAKKSKKDVEKLIDKTVKDSKKRTKHFGVRTDKSREAYKLVIEDRKDVIDPKGMWEWKSRDGKLSLKDLNFIQNSLIFSKNRDNVAKKVTEFYNKKNRAEIDAKILIKNLLMDPDNTFLYTKSSKKRKAEKGLHKFGNTDVVDNIANALFEYVQDYPKNEVINRQMIIEMIPKDADIPLLSRQVQEKYRNLVGKLPEKKRNATLEKERTELFNNISKPKYWNAQLLGFLIQQDEAIGKFLKGQMRFGNPFMKDKIKGYFQTMDCQDAKSLSHGLVTFNRNKTPKETAMYNRLILSEFNKCKHRARVKEKSLMNLRASGRPTPGVARLEFIDESDDENF